MKPTIIYALIDPVTGQVKYVGKTIQTLKQRLAAHLCAARGNTHTHSSRWMGGLLKQGLIPEVEILEVATDDWQEAEEFWIANMRFLGCHLTNHTGGGDGLTSYRHTPQTIENMRRAQQKRRAEQIVDPLAGRKRPPEVLKKMSESQKGRTVSDERRAKISATLTGRTLPPEVRAKVSAALKGKKRGPQSLEQRQQHSQRMKGRQISEEQRAKISAALKGRPKSEEHRRKLSEMASLRGPVQRTYTEEYRQWARERMLGNKLAQTPGRAQKLSDALRGRKLSEEHRANISAGNLGHAVSEETRRKISEAKRARDIERRLLATADSESVTT